MAELYLYYLLTRDQKHVATPNVKQPSKIENDPRWIISGHIPAVWGARQRMIKAAREERLSAKSPVHNNFFFHRTGIYPFQMAAAIVSFQFGNILPKHQNRIRPRSYFDLARQHLVRRRWSSVGQHWGVFKIEAPHARLNLPRRWLRSAPLPLDEEQRRFAPFIRLCIFRGDAARKTTLRDAQFNSAGLVSIRIAMGFGGFPASTE